METKLFLVVTYHMLPGHRDAFLTEVAQAGLQEFFCSEKGCERYEYLLPAQDADRLILLEQWAGAAQQAAHSCTSQMDALKQIKEKHVASTELLRFSPAE